MFFPECPEPPPSKKGDWLVLIFGAGLNFYSENSFQAFIQDYHPYPSSKRREGLVLIFGAGVNVNSEDSFQASV